MSDIVVGKIADLLLERGEWLAVAESCTGGWVAKRLTDLPGSSGWFDRGLVTYSNRAKTELLGVDAATLDRHGAVSQETVSAMMAGLLERSPVDWVAAVSGIAGPGGGTADKPVGTVWMGWQMRGQAPSVVRQVFDGDREEVRENAVDRVLNGLLESLSGIRA